MTTKTLEEIATQPAAPAPAQLGQGTAVEQSRAVAEVQAAVVVAQERPRDLNAALREMHQSCSLQAMAERAFYRYNRGGSNVSGPSVHLMRELARAFGNVQYGIHELRRDDKAGESEMLAYAWDVQTNTRSAQVFIVPHKRDRKDKKTGKPEQVALSDLRDVYENNANQGARRLREAIRSVLPPWFVEQAIELCTQTLRDGGGRPLPQRINDAIASFDQMGVRADQLEGKLGRPRAEWTEHDIAQLTVSYKSLQRGEITVTEEFPAARVTTAEITRTGPAGTTDTATSAPEHP